MSTSNYLKKLQELKTKAGISGDSNSTNKNSNSSSQSVLERIKTKARDGGADLETVKSWFADSESAINSMNEYYKANEGKWVSNFGGDTASKISKLLVSADIVGEYLRNHKSEFSNYDSLSKAYSSYREYLEKAAKQNSEMAEYYSQWSNEEDYQKSSIGWLNSDAETNEENSTKRKEYYQSNEDRITEIEDELPWYAKTWLPNWAENIFLSDEQEALRDEAEKREAENNQYDRTQGVLDQYYTPVTDEFKQNASYRDYSNASREELWDYDMTESAGSVALNSGGYFDEEGNIRDKNGNIVRYANAPEVQDKLGMFLSAVKDGTMSDYVNELSATNGNYTNTWGNLMQEGDVNGWKYLTEHEINIYYDLYKREGQEAAYKFLSDMSTELTRRETQERKNHINEAPILEQIGLNIASVPMNVIGGVTATIGDVSNLIQGKEVNPYSRSHMFSNDASAIRQDTASDINRATGNLALPWVGTTFGDVYQALMSGADSFMASYIPGGHYLLGLNAASYEMKELYERGASTEQMLAGGILAGAAESFFEKYSIGELNKIKNLDTKSVKSLTDGFVRTMIMGGVEASEEMATEIANTISDALVMGSQSDWVDFETFLKNVVNAGIGGFISGGAMGGIASIGNNIEYNKRAEEYGKTIIDQGGQESVDALKQLALGMYSNEGGSEALKGVKLAGNLTSAKNVGKLADLMEGTVTSKNRAEIESALIEKGLSKKDAKRVSEYLNKASQGYEFSEAEASEVEGNDKIMEVLRDVVGDPNSSINNRTRTFIEAKSGINAEAYNKAVNEYTGETPTDSEVNLPRQEINAPVGENTTIKENATEGVVEASTEVAENDLESTEESTVTLESASAKYGAQAKAMIGTYKAGQDVAKYDKAYNVAYDMGRSGVALSYVMNSESTSYLTENQRELAYEAGKAAADTSAKEQDSKIKKAANGKTGRKKGTVKGEGVTIADLKKSFNDTQNRAYKVLTTIAEVTGLDIVLYKSETNADGEFEGAQGRFDWSDDKLYIDINAGLKGVNSVDDLAKYAMLRTFSHEFTHFIEKYNSIWYNELRKVVFEELTARGENVHDLIEEKQAMTPGMTYEKASREVVAEAMTDILPDSQFVETLANEHKNIFNKLLEKLKEFIADVKAYFNSIGHNRSREANALKDDTLHYLENIVKLFDKVAVEAVENYQKTVATEETAEAQSENDWLDDIDTAVVRENLEKHGIVNGQLVDENKLNASPIVQMVETEVEKQEKITSTESIKADNNSQNDSLATKVLREMGGKDLGGGMTDVTDIFFPELAKKETVEADPYEEVSNRLSKASRFYVGEKEGYLFRIYKNGEQWQGLIDKVTQHYDEKGTPYSVKQTGGFNYKSEIFTNRADAIEDIIAVARNNKLLEAEATSEAKGTPSETTDVSKKTQKAGKVKSAKKSDWSAGDVSWTIPGKKNPIAYSTKATSDLIEVLADDNPTATISELKEKINYDVEAKKVLQQYIDAGYGDQVASEWFSRNHKTGTPTTQGNGEITEVNENGENVDNRSTVQQSDSDRQGDTQVLEGLQTEDVQGNVQRGDSVGDPVKRGQEVGRDDNNSDAAGTRRGSGEGNSESGDLRRDDGLTPEAAEKLHEEVTEQIEQQSTELPKGKNFVIGDSLDLPNGEKSRYKANVEAIRLVKKLEAEGRYATEAEQVILSKYVGWGGLANAFDERKAEWAKEYTELKELLTKEEYELARGSTLNAHYTEISVIKAMYDGLKQLGFNGGRMMEPSSGVGNFVGAMPADMSAKVKSWTMVELDGITGLIAKYLYPNADVRIQGFEKANIPNNYMDVIISNVPFGNYPITDKAYPKKVTSAIHNYFFAKSLDKVRPGGIVMFITSSYTMNSRDETVRRYIMQRADLLGAIRLPDSAFKGNAGTEVVTDILVLKKRPANTPYSGENFLEAPYKYIQGWSGAYINSYFDEHPEMVLGTATMDGKMYRGDSLTYKALEGKGSLADQIREAFTHIEGKMEYPAQLSPEKTNFAVERASKKTKENGYVAKDGKIYQNKDGELVEQTLTPKNAERIKGMLEIRDAAKTLMNAQQQGLNEAEIKKARTNLNKLYDAFVKKNGFLNAPSNKSAFSADPDRYSLFALENWNPDEKKATKSDIFTKNTIAPNRTVTAAKNVAEGLIVSVNKTGGVDVSLIARLTGKTEADVTRELIDSRQVFKNRDGVLETAETYLSGNVRAKLRDAEALVPMDSDYQKNVEALKAIIPEDVGYQDIFVNPGTPWIPSSVYSDFAAYMLGSSNSEWRQNVDVTRNADTGNFTVELKNSYLKFNAANTQKWGTSRRSFLDLFDAMLNSKSVVIRDKLDDGSFVINKEATAAANEKIENITKEFQEWLWKDETRRTELATLYNETFNSIVTPTYNGDNLTVNGANAMKPLRPHQRNAVQRVISSGGNTLLAHKVGAGKTYEMAAAAMKLKELGLVKKPLFAVPKSLVAQWGTEFIDFFPTAKLLVAEASDFSTANRKVFMNRIANGDYDAVIVSYEQFEKLPVSDDFTKELYQEQMDSIIAAIEEAKADKGAKALSVKDLEKKRKSLQAKIDKLTDKAKDEGNINFEELGVDSLFIDEAHNFKNLFYTTSMTNVSGLGNKDGSKRAFDLYTKVRYLQKLNGGRGIVFATATPVMNSMSEMYIMQKYLQPDLLDQLGLSTFDAWAKQFGEVVNGVEIKPSGQGYRVKQSFSRFKNMSELQLLFRNFADVLTDIPGLKIPKMKGGKVNVVVCEPGQFQKDYMKELEKRADNIKNVDPSEDNMLKITSDGRKISYTQRMIEPTLPYEEGCKIYRCADNVVKAYNESKDIKGTQLIFCDMATPKGKSKTETTETDDVSMDMESAKLYDDIKARLIGGGIPANEIAFIHDADTDQKKKKLFADVNDGKVRVLIGSTGKMGVGMNAQKRVVAIHHLDAPWRPGDVEQRNGRAFRQGNINEEVECFTYVTEGSFDARLWDILERKQNFINQVMNGESIGRETEDTGEVTLSAAEVKALASGSPLILEQVQLDTDIKKLESLYKAHQSAVRFARERLEKDKGTIEVLEQRIEKGKTDMLSIKDTYSEGKFSITIGKQKFTEKKDAGVALMAEATAKAVDTEYTTIGSFAGFNVRVIKTSEGIKGIISGKIGYSFNTYPNNTTFMINHIISVVESISEKVNAWNSQLAETKKDMAEQEKLINEPFAKQAELDEKRKRYNEVMAILNPKEEQSLDSVSEDTVQEQSRAYLDTSDTKYAVDNSNQNKYKGIGKARELYSTSSDYRMKLRVYSIDEISNLYDRGSLGAEYDILFNRLYDFCKNAGVTFSVVPEIKHDGKNAHGSTMGKNIELSQQTFNNAEISNERKSKVILHEMLHAGTVYAIEIYDLAKAEGVTAELPKNIYKAAKEIYTVYTAISKDPKFTGTYGVQNPQEMVAELSNAVFVDKLKNSYPSPWYKLLEAICELLGINKTFTNYDMLRKAVDRLLSDPNYEIADEYHNHVNAINPYYLDESQYTEYQQRTDTLTDREVLELAANEVKVSDLTQAENNALTIFQDRLSKLKDLQADRAEQGRLYKEQQFGAKPNREKASETLNRMHVLDDQIKKATADVLTVEEKEVLKRVLQKARKVVEVKERQHGQEILNRWRDRRRNADSIKKYRDRIKGDVDELTNWIIGPNNKDIAKHVPDVLKNSVIPFLSSINFMSKRSLKGGDATVSDKEFIKRLESLQGAIKSNIDVYGLYSGYNDLPADFMDSLENFRKSAQSLLDKSEGEFIINQMTSEELKELSKVVRTLKKYIMQINRFHNNAMYQHVYEAGDNSVEYLKELKTAGNTGDISNFVLWQQIRPAYAFERFGEGGKAIYDGLRRGQAKLAFNTKEIERFSLSAYTEKEVKAWEDEIKTFNLGNDLVKIPVSHIMSFYELTKDPEALVHIQGDGIRVATYTHKGKKISDVGHILTVGEFNQIVSSLTDRQREVADRLQKYMAEQGGKWGNYVSVARFGEELFTNPHYFPINSDGRHLSSNVEEHPSAASLYALLNMSFTKSRKEGANNRIVLYSIFDVFANHMASMAQYNAMALPILDALKWFNYQQVFVDENGNKIVLDSVRERMDKAYGVPEETRPGSGKQGYAETFFVNIIKAFNGTAAQGTQYDSLGLKSMHRYNVAQVAYNLRVVVQQPLSVTRAGLLIDYRSIIKGMKLSPSAIKKNVEEMNKYSGIAAWKSLGFYDVNISRGLTHLIKHDSTWLDKVGDVGMWGAEKADVLTWSAIWSACKEEVAKEQHLTPESEGFYEEVTKLFEDVIYKTQVVDSILTKNEFMRDKGTFARLVGSFMSEPTTNASMLIDAYDKYNLDLQRGMTRQQAWQRNKNNVGRTLYVYGVGAVLLAAVQAAADALRDDDEYEEYGEKWLEAFVGNFIDELMPFNKLPILADFYDLAKELLSTFGVDTYGTPPQSVFMQWYDSLVKGVEIIADKISGEDTNYTWYGGIYKLLQAVSGMSGLPMASATREIITAWNNTVGAMAPSLKVKTYESSELAQIRYAYEDGYLTYDEAVNLLLEKGLADNENDAYFTIQGWEAGEGYSRYDAIYDAVLNGGDFDSAMEELVSHGYTEEEVLRQVKSQIGKWYYDDESDIRVTKQQAIDMLGKYTDMTADEITETVNKWSCEVVTGIKYNDIDEEFMEGNITASRAIEMYVRYGSMTKEKATEKVAVLKFVKENPECEGITYSAVAGYNEYCESCGVPADTYYEAWQYKNTLSGTVKEPMMQYIHSLNLSARQKDSLYLAFGWAESKLYEAPWR